MSKSIGMERQSVINSVRTPLGFLVLGLLIIDGTLASLAIVLPNFSELLVWTIVISIPVFVATVVFLAVWRPEALSGGRPLQDIHANQFASDLFISLDGALSNLEPLEREEAWLTVSDVITSDEKQDSSYHRFCFVVSEKLRNLADLTNKKVKAGAGESENT